MKVSELIAKLDPSPFLDRNTFGGVAIFVLLLGFLLGHVLHERYKRDCDREKER